MTTTTPKVPGLKPREWSPDAAPLETIDDVLDALDGAISIGWRASLRPLAPVSTKSAMNCANRFRDEPLDT
jgi:hypothetical protein